MSRFGAYIQPSLCCRNGSTYWEFNDPERLQALRALNYSLFLQTAPPGLNHSGGPEDRKCTRIGFKLPAGMPQGALRPRAYNSQVDTALCFGPRHPVELCRLISYRWLNRVTRLFPSSP